MSISRAQQAKVIDHEIFAEMREMLEDEFEELLVEFNDDTKDMLAQLSDAANQGQLETISTLCHTLASSSGHLGFLQLSETAREVELMAREQAGQHDCAAWVNQLQQCYQQLARQLGE